MELILWRHAEAADGGADLERPLTAHGRRQAQQMAEWLESRLPKDLRSPFRKIVRAVRGAEAIQLALEYRPSAISLDVFLPDMLGWSVLSHLKKTSQTRHIPVQIVTLDENRQHGLARGAFAYLTKPVSSEAIGAALARIKDFAKPRRKRLLVVEDDAAEQLGIKELLAHDDIEIECVGTGGAALESLRAVSCAKLQEPEPGRIIRRTPRRRAQSKQRKQQQRPYDEQRLRPVPCVQVHKQS